MHSRISLSLRIWRNCVCALAFLLTGGCIQGVPPKDFPPIGHVTRLEVNDSMSKPLKIITRTTQIDKVVLFVDERRRNWETPLYGIPVPRLVINFYDGSQFKGHFGLGPNFFEVQLEGVFVSKSATKQEITDALRLLDLTEREYEEWMSKLSMPSK